MQYPDLLTLWIGSITWSIVFLIAVSLYLYAKRKSRVGGSDSGPSKISDFVFVFVLLGLLALYIVSINRTSAILFGVGNIVVEVVLVIYAVRNRRT